MRQHHAINSKTTIINMCLGFGVFWLLGGFIILLIGIMPLFSILDLPVELFKYISVLFAFLSMMGGIRYAFIVREREREELRKKIGTRCTECGSDDIQFPATLQFNKNNQRFKNVEAIHGESVKCLSCGAMGKYEIYHPWAEV